MPMDEAAVRERATAFSDALVVGDVETAIGDFSDELRRNLGEVLSLLPLPATEVTIESVDRGGSAFVAVLRLVGEIDEVQVQTRWKDRGGEPKIVEVSHLSRSAREPEAEPGADLEDGEGAPERAAEANRASA
jgi:hypothetical protein